MYKIAVTNRKACKSQSLFECIDLAVKDGINQLVIREKDLNIRELIEFSSKIINYLKDSGICIVINAGNASDEKEILQLMERTNCKNIQLPLYTLDKIKDFMIIRKSADIIGIPVHSLSDVAKAEDFFADYIIAGHIFRTDCKKDIPPKGLDFLQKVCRKTSIPVYAIGGINNENIINVIERGAAGGCFMSKYFH